MDGPIERQLVGLEPAQSEDLPRVLAVLAVLPIQYADKERALKLWADHAGLSFDPTWLDLLIPVKPPRKEP